MARLILLCLLLALALTCQSSPMITNLPPNTVPAVTVLRSLSEFHKTMREIESLGIIGTYKSGENDCSNITVRLWDALAVRGYKPYIAIGWLLPRDALAKFEGRWLWTGKQVVSHSCVMLFVAGDNSPSVTVVWVEPLTLKAYYPWYVEFMPTRIVENSEQAEAIWPGEFTRENKRR